MDEGMAAPTLALVALAVVGATLVLELVARRRRWRGWFQTGFALGTSLRALPAAPAASGASGSVAWEVVDDGRCVLWWTRAGAAAPRGLHGVAWLIVDRHGEVQLDVRWAPSWTPAVALVWFAGLGSARGEAALVGPLAALLLGAFLYAYWHAALVAARELRYGLARVAEESR